MLAGRVVIPSSALDGEGEGEGVDFRAVFELRLELRLLFVVRLELVDSLPVVFAAFPLGLFGAASLPDQLRDQRMAAVIPKLIINTAPRTSTQREFLRVGEVGGGVIGLCQSGGEDWFIKIGSG